jgi:putative SOS response-associated peptidase YedK
MLIDCLWSHWTDPKEPDLRGFAAITDEPPGDIAAAGHDRCIINLRPEHLDAWLTRTVEVRKNSKTSSPITPSRLISTPLWRLRDCDREIYVI